MTVTDAALWSFDSFSCEIGRTGDTAWVRPMGELDLDTAPQLEETIAAVREEGGPRLLC